MTSFHPIPTRENASNHPNHSPNSTHKHAPLTAPFLPIPSYLSLPLPLTPLSPSITLPIPQSLTHQAPVYFPMDSIALGGSSSSITADLIELFERQKPSDPTEPSIPTVTTAYSVPFLRPVLRSDSSDIRGFFRDNLQYS
jgi:hypothetical protein